MNTEKAKSSWTNVSESDTLESLEEQIAALQERMEKKKREKIVKDKFGEFQTVKKKKQNKEVTYFRAYYYKDGKRKDATASTEEGLVAKLWAMLEDEESHVNQNATVEQVFEHYRESRKQMCENGNISSQTRDYDSSNWRRFYAGKPFSKMCIRDVKAIHIRREYERICGNGEYTKEAFSKATSLLHGIYDEAILLGIVDVNLAKAVTPKGLKFKLKEIKDGEVEQEVYTKEEIETLRAYLETLPEDTYTLAVMLATYLCMRIGELRGLIWADYHPEMNKIWVGRQITQGEKGSTKRSDRVSYPKGGKESGRRWVKVTSEAARILEKLRVINGEKEYILHASRDAKFSISENRFNAHLKKYCEACGVRYRSSHNFRFFGISALYEAGEKERDIQYVAGHSSVVTTRHYDRSKTSGPSLEMMEKAIG